MTFWSPDAIRHLYLTSTSIAEMILRSALVYVFLIVVLRLSGKRLLAQLSPFDFVVILILSNTLQNAILGEDNSVAGGIVRAVSLLGLNWAFVRFDVWLNEAVDRNRRRAEDGSGAHSAMFALLEQIVDGSADRLIVNGAIFHQVRRREGITLNQLRAALHRQGIRSVKDVARAQLDPGGVLYVERKDQTPDTAWREDLTARLNRIEQLLASHTRSTQ